MEKTTYTIERRGITVTATFRVWSQVEGCVCTVDLHIQGRTKSQTVTGACLRLLYGTFGSAPRFAIYDLSLRLPSRWRQLAIDAALRCALEQKIAEEKAEGEGAA